MQSCPVSVWFSLYFYLPIDGAEESVFLQWLIDVDRILMLLILILFLYKRYLKEALVLKLNSFVRFYKL